MESKRYNKPVNIVKKKQMHSNNRKQTSGYQWGEGREERQDRGGGSGRHKLLGERQTQGCTVQHGHRANIL